MSIELQDMAKLRAVYRYSSTGIYHLILMEQPQPEITRKSLCGRPSRIPIDRVERLPLESIPEHLRCQQCLKIAEKRDD